MSISWHKSTCPFCGFGCGLMVGVEDGNVVAVRGMEDHPANKCEICLMPSSYPSIFDHKDRH